MEYEDKLNILKKVLQDYNLDLNDAEVYNFFYRDRIKYPSEYSKQTGKRFAFSRSVRPIKQKILPSDFENSGYWRSSDGTLMDWFMYENAGSNPLVWNNIGKPTFDVKKSFENTREIGGPIFCDVEGKIFNGGDGNHRLLTLIINHFLELKSAKTEEERKQINEKYEMTLEVLHPIGEELSNLLGEISNELYDAYYQKDTERRFPNLVCQFRDRTFKNYLEKAYIADYNPESEIFTYNFNGEHFAGTEEELTNWLKTKENNKDPILQWESEGVYYLSCYNMVYKSKNKKDIDDIIAKVKDGYKRGKFQYSNILEIKDLETQTYDVKFPGFWLEDKAKSQEFATIINDILSGEYKDVLLTKLRDKNYFSGYFDEQVKTAFGYWGGFSMPELEYKNLTKAEFLKLKELLLALQDDLEYVQNKNEASV